MTTRVESAGPELLKCQWWLKMKLRCFALPASIPKDIRMYGTYFCTSPEVLIWIIYCMKVAAFSLQYATVPSYLLPYGILYSRYVFKLQRYLLWL